MNRSIARRLAAASTAGALALGAATACSSASDSGSGGKSLTYWSFWTKGEPQQLALAAEFAQFTKQTGIKVNVQWQGRDVLTKLAPTLHSQPAADLMDNSYNNVKGTMAPGTATDLSSVLPTKIPGESDTIGQAIPADIQKLVQVNGQLPLLPYQVTCTTLWFNGARLADLTSNPPTTWSAFLNLLDKRKAAGATPLALDGDISGYNAYWYVSLIVSTHGVGAFHQAAGDKTGATWDMPEFLAAAKQIEHLAKGGYFASGYNASKFPALQQKWANNKADLILMSSWLPNESKPYAAAGFELRSFAFPSNGASRDPVMCSTNGWVIPAKAKNKSAAEKLVAFLFGKQQMQAFADKTSSLSVRSDVTAAPTLADQAALIKGHGTYPSIDGVSADYNDWYTKVFQPLDDDLITGRVGASDFISKLKSQSTDYWKRAK